MQAAKDAQAHETVGLTEAARALGVSKQTIRNHLQAGHLKGTKRAGTYGTEWRFRPAVLAAFAAEHYGRELAPPAPVLAPTLGPKPLATLSADVRELYERLVAATAEASRYKALCEVTESTKAEDAAHFAAGVARLTQEAEAAKAEAAEAAAELERLRSRGPLARLFRRK